MGVYMGAQLLGVFYPGRSFTLKKRFHHIAYEMKANLILTLKKFTERNSDIWFESYSQNSFGNSNL